MAKVGKKTVIKYDELVILVTVPAEPGVILYIVINFLFWQKRSYEKPNSMDTDHSAYCIYCAILHYAP